MSERTSWIIQKRINKKRTTVVEKIYDEKIANEWLAMKKRNYPNDKFKKVKI